MFPRFSDQARLSDNRADRAVERVRNLISHPSIAEAWSPLPSHVWPQAGQVSVVFSMKEALGASLRHASGFQRPHISSGKRGRQPRLAFVASETDAPAALSFRGNFDDPRHAWTKILVVRALLTGEDPITWPIWTDDHEASHAAGNPPHSLRFALSPSGSSSLVHRCGMVEKGKSLKWPKLPFNSWVAVLASWDSFSGTIGISVNGGDWRIAAGPRDQTISASGLIGAQSTRRHVSSYRGEIAFAALHREALHLSDHRQHVQGWNDALLSLVQLS